MNYLNAISFGSRILKENNINNHILDSELLLAYSLNLTREKLLINLNTNLSKKAYNKYKDFLIRRKNKEPIAYILKKKEFWKHEFFVNSNVLIPRPETEIIVEEILKKISFDTSKKILDVGTGCGCIIISIIKNRPLCKATAIDISKKALLIAKYNAKMHHLQNKISFVNIDIDKFQHNNYDFILSNPPYINIINYKRLEDNVKLYEPKVALEAGIDGLSEIKKLIIKSKKLLKNKGKLIFEIGENQEQKIKLLLNKYGFHVNKLIKDYRSNPRVIVSTKFN